MQTSLSHTLCTRAAHALILSACVSANALAETPTPNSPPAQTPKLEIGVQSVGNDTQGVVGVTVVADNTAFRLVGDYSRRSQHILLGGGLQLGSNHHLVGGFSIGREPIPDHSAKMNGKSTLLRLTGAQPMDGVRQWFLEGLYQQTSSRLLSVSDSPFDDFQTDNNGTMASSTHTHTVVTTRDYFHGGRRTEVSATVEANAGDHGLTAVQWLHGRTRLLDVTGRYDRLGVKYQRFLPAHQANWSVSVTTDRRFQLGAEMRLERLGATALIQAFKNTRDDQSHGVYLGLRFDLGQTPSKPGHRPEVNLALMRETVHGMYAPRNYFGEIRRSQEKIVSDHSTESLSVAPGEVTHPVDPAPTQIQLQQTTLLTLTDLTDPSNLKLVVPSAVTAGKLQCSDIAQAPLTPNTCTFTGGNALISVAPNGTVTFGPGTYDENSFVISVTATDQAGSVYTTTLKLRFDTRRP